MEKRIHTAPFEPQTPLPGPSSADNPPQTPTHARTKYLIRALAVSFTELERKVGASAINKVISVLKDPAFSISEFDCAIRTTHECLSLTISLVDEQLCHNGFSPVQIVDDAGTCSGTAYLRDPVEIVQRHLPLDNTENTLYSPITKKDSDGNELFNHPLETPIARAVHQFVGETVMGSLQEEVVWNDTPTPGPQSFFGLIQLYTDKSCTTLKTSDVVSYPVQIFLLNFSSHCRHRCINTGSTIVGFLTVNVSSGTKTSTLD